MNTATKKLYITLLMVVTSFLSCNIPEEEPILDSEERKRLLHCVPVRQYATIETDASGEKKIFFYSVIRDTSTNEYFERFVRSFKPKNQVFILGYVELSDFSMAGQGIFYVDPDSGPMLLRYEGARIVKRLVGGDSPWTIARALGNPSVADWIKRGGIYPGKDLVIDGDILEAVCYWGKAFNLPDKNYRIFGQRVRRVVVKGSDIEEGQGPNEIFVRKYAILEKDTSRGQKLSFYNVFQDTLRKERREHFIWSLKPETQVYIVGYERILPELTARGRGIYYFDPGSDAILFDYEDARIVKRIVKSDSQWKIAKELGNVSLANKMTTGIIHPGDTLVIDFEILEAIGWSKEAFDLPNEDYWIIGERIGEVLIKESSYESKSRR